MASTEDDSKQRMAVGGGIAGLGIAASFMVPLYLGAAPFSGPSLMIGAQAVGLGLVMVLSGLLKRRKLHRATPAH